MTCSNCGSSRLRRSKRSLGERVFLPIVLIRPFRCEDCISRFYGWLWQSPQTSSTEADVNSRVYQSSTAALHSAGYRIRGVRRSVILKGLQPFLRLTGTPIASWLSKPIHQQRSGNVKLARAQAVGASMQPSAGHLNTAEPQTGYISGPSKPQSTPEILGVIPERKIEEI
jgi:hypothetical protein